MPVTTVLSEEGSATIIGDESGGMFAHRFSWSAAFAGSILATAVTLFLLALGAGFGLSLVSLQNAATPTLLTLGAIYFLTANAFGFAAGGHLAGRLIGPALETAKEEEFRSAAHGLVVWALTVVATAALLAIGSITAGSSIITATASVNRMDNAQGPSLTPPYVGYWVDLLFRPGPGPSQASLAWTQYAQTDNGTATDASPAPQSPMAPESNQVAPSEPSAQSHTLDSTTAPAGTAPPSTPPTATAPAVAAPAPSAAMPNHPHDQEIPITPTNFTPPASLTSDKAETTRIIEVGMAKGMRLNQYDKDRITALVMQDTGLSAPEAQRRVDNAETRIHNDDADAMELARKVASHVSLWIAISLLFGAIVAVMAAISARWEDDRVTFGWPRKEPG